MCLRLGVEKNLTLERESKDEIAKFKYPFMEDYKIGLKNNAFCNLSTIFLKLKIFEHYKLPRAFIEQESYQSNQKSKQNECYKNKEQKPEVV